MIDSFAYFNEQDIFFLRMEYLSPYVDKFVIVELDTTFSLLPHEKMFDQVYKKLPDNIKKKIVYEFIEVDKDSIVYTGDPGDIDYKNKSRLIDNIMREKKAELIRSISSTDYLMMSDIDEFWDPRKIKEAKKLIDRHGTMCWKQDFRSAFIDWRNVIGWWPGTKGARIDTLPENICANFYISKSKSFGHYENRMVDGGWHFTMMGDQQTKTEQISAKRETPGWEKKLNLSSAEIAEGMLDNNYNSVVKKGKMRCVKVDERENLDPDLYNLAKKYKKLWSGKLKP